MTSTLTKTGLFFCILLLCFGCQKPSTPKSVVEEASFKKPTASEIFILRSKCAELGKNILEENVIGSALAQVQVSHYDPKTNRCYVELDVHMADLSKYEDYHFRYLHDGQTGEMLAWSGSKKGVKSWYPLGLDYDAADAKIDALMADDRKQ